jgi:hypothetical protein
MGILLFNWSGYRLLTAYWENKANTRLEAQIDENGYDESQLISIKIPTGHISSYSHAGAFERVDGQVEIGGIQYKYVKRRLYNDSIELLCIPNHSAMGVQTARNEFFRLVNDLQHNNKGGKSDQHPGSSKNFTGEYYTVNEILAFTAERSFTILPARSDKPAGICSSIILTAEQPPDFHA